MADVDTPEERRKKKCRSVINNGLRDGKIKKPRCCSVCHKPSSKLQFHHTDYKNPKKGRWECPSCHKVTTDKSHGKSRVSGQKK